MKRRFPRRAPCSRVLPLAWSLVWTLVWAAPLFSCPFAFASYYPGMADEEGRAEWWRILGDPYQASMLREAGVTRMEARGFHLMCALGTAEQVREALAGGEDPNREDAERGGQRPIADAAARNPDPEVIRILIKAGADPNAVGKVYQRTPLFQAVLFNPHPGPVIRALVEGGADLSHRDFERHTILQTALSGHFDRSEGVAEFVFEPREEALLALLESGASVTEGDGKNYSALGAYLGGCEQRNREPGLKVVTAMFDAGADPNVPDRDDRDPLLFLAVSLDSGHGGPENASLTRLFLDRGATRIANGDKKTALHEAAFYGNAAAAKLLLERFPGENLAARADSLGRTPLHILAEWEVEALPRVGEILLRAGADPNAAGRDGRTPLHALARKSMQAAGPRGSREEYSEGLKTRLAGIAFLLQNGAAERLDEAGRSALHAACEGAVLPHEEIGLLAEAGFDVNRRDAEGATPMMLWLAAASHRLKDPYERERVLPALPQDAAFLLSLQANPALVDKRGRRAVDFLGKNLRESLEERSPETIALLEKTAPPAKTLLELCAAGCDEAAIRQALAGGLDIDPRDKEGDTPLHLAASRGDVETVKALLACGAPLGVVNDARQNALGVAVLQRSRPVFEALMAAGADINAQGYTTFWSGGPRTVEMTPLAGAIYYGRKDDFAYLLRWKPDLEAKTRIYSDDDRTGTALHAAALLNSSEMLERLLTLGARTEVGLSRMADTPLHLAARNGDVACVELLLRHGAKVDMYNTAWNTPLHLAAQEGRAACAALLLRHGAAVNARNSDEDTPLHFAAGVGNAECVKLLLEHGADPTLKNMYNSTPAMRTEDPEIQKLLAP